MAKRKIKLIQSELKLQRDALARYERYLPTLKLKEQRVRSSIVQIRRVQNLVKEKAEAIHKHIATYKSVFNDIAGINIQHLATPHRITTTTQSIAGVHIPAFENASFPQADYSLFGTRAWVDMALRDLRELNLLQARLEILELSLDLLQAEQIKTMRRINLFEKIKIPETLDNIRCIRIAVGNRMTASVVRAKIAKAKREREKNLTCTV
jgi:V/A-type H+/Na+-transporting ATPase subunit D